MTTHDDTPTTPSLAARAGREYSVYSAPELQAQADRRDAVDALRQHAASMRAEEIAAFTAPQVTDDHGRLI